MTEYTVYNLYTIFVEKPQLSTSILEDLPLSLTNDLRLVWANCAINPIIYSFVGKDFRENMLDIFGRFNGDKKILTKFLNTERRRRRRAVMPDPRKGPTHISSLRP